VDEVVKWITGNPISDAKFMRDLLGGMYVIDDLLPQPSWPDDHASKVVVLISNLEQRDEFAMVRLARASGLMLVVRRADTFNA
jgi:hypothetical protein